MSPLPHLSLFWDVSLFQAGFIRFQANPCSRNCMADRKNVSTISRRLSENKAVSMEWEASAATYDPLYRAGPISDKPCGRKHLQRLTSLQQEFVKIYWLKFWSPGRFNTVSEGSCQESPGSSADGTNLPRESNSGFLDPLWIGRRCPDTCDIHYHAVQLKGIVEGE